MEFHLFYCHVLKRPPFWVMLAPLSKINWSYMCVSLSGLYSCFIVYVSILLPILHYLDFQKRFHLFIFRERGSEGGREKHQCMIASHTPPTGGLACKPGRCPSWKSSWWPFSSQAGAQSTELHQPGLHYLDYCSLTLLAWVLFSKVVLVILGIFISILILESAVDF